MYQDADRLLPALLKEGSSGGLARAGLHDERLAKRMVARDQELCAAMETF
jgi:hypothetical protein